MKKPKKKNIRIVTHESGEKTPSHPFVTWLKWVTTGHIFSAGGHLYAISDTKEIDKGRMVSIIPLHFGENNPTLTWEEALPHG